ncbi:hypothetical protein GCM10009528_47640 [Kineococcus aurantiacus]
MRSTDSRPAEGVICSVVKKSSVPATCPPCSTGKQIPERIPARCATGARTQSLSSLRSATNTRSRWRQARPDSPTPSAKVAARVTRRNSSPAVPLSCSKRRTRAARSSRQNEA